MKVVLWHLTECWVQSESIKLLEGGKGDVNCLAKTLNEMSDHGQGGKKDVSIQDKDGVSWNELQKGMSGAFRCAATHGGHGRRRRELLISDLSALSDSKGLTD
jgi:hypothetical protein